MKIAGTWADPISFQFHIKAKQKFREMMDADPDKTGKSLGILRELEFDERLAHEDGDQNVLNEPFLIHLINDYMKHFSSYKPGIFEKKVTPKMLKFGLALYRQDTAYFERIGGIISYIVINAERFDSMDKDYLIELNNIRDWWDINDRRERTREWIRWIFDYIIKHYEKDTPKKRFYYKSVNHVLYFIYLNRKNWQFVENYYPDKWFGKVKGSQITALYGGNF